MLTEVGSIVKHKNRGSYKWMWGVQYEFRGTTNKDGYTYVVLYGPLNPPKGYYSKKTRAKIREIRLKRFKKFYF